MGETFWKALFLTIPHHLNILKDIPIPDVFKAIILLAGIALVFNFIEWFLRLIKGHDNSKDSDSKSKHTAVDKFGTSDDISSTLEYYDNMHEAETEHRYKLINHNLPAILEWISQSGHVDKYDYLINNRNLAATDPEYQRRYRDYWKLLGIIVSPDFCNKYFAILQINLNNPTNLNQVVRELYKIPVNARGHRKIHFSFSSKLIHMVDPHSPIYDSMVKSFFFFSSKAKTFEERISELLKFHQFLITEYQRVLNEGLLKESIEAFRKRFRPETFTDEKIIDSLIWAFVILSERGVIHR